jgi:hypothetical protein
MFQPKYPRVDRRVVRGIRAFLDAKPYRQAHGEQVALLNTLAAACARAYRMPAPRVTVEPHAAEDGRLGYFDDACNTIVLPRVSLMATLYRVARLRGFTSRAAKAWAVSAVHLASAKTLRNFVRKGTLRWSVAKPAVETVDEPISVTV